MVINQKLESSIKANLRIAEENRCASNLCLVNIRQSPKKAIIT